MISPAVGRGFSVGLGLCLLALSGCAHAPKPGSDTKSEIADKSGATIKPGSMIATSPQGEITIRGVRLENTNFDFPITINSKVEQWVDYFLGRGRPHFERYLERSELFIPYITPLLKQNGLPEDLVYLAMIESGFNNHARSHAKAVGPWQFISATGKRYGLMVNWWVDERRDTRKSTLAAVEYLRDLYGIFNSWELAAAAYNAGEAKIARAIQRFGTKDFWTLTKQRFLRVETRDYVPKIIAAALLAKNRTQFGFPASTIHPGRGEAIAGNGEVVKVEKSDPNEAKATVPEGETLASILKEEEEAAKEEEADEPAPTVLADGAVQPEGVVPTPVVNREPVQLAKPVPTPLVSKKGEVSGEQLVEIEVQSPADLLRVADAAELSYGTVKSLNPEILRWCTPPNVSTYRIRLPASVKDKFLEAYNHAAFPRKVEFLSYKVRRGESLTRIARHFGIRPDPMSDLNRISSKVPLRNGTRVLLPIPNDRSRTLASLEVIDPPSRRRKYRRGRARSKQSYKISYKRRQSARARGQIGVDGT